MVEDDAILIDICEMSDRMLAEPIVELTTPGLTTASPQTELQARQKPHFEEQSIKVFGIYFSDAIWQLPF